MGEKKRENTLFSKQYLLAYTCIREHASTRDLRTCVAVKPQKLFFLGAREKRPPMPAPTLMRRLLLWNATVSRDRERTRVLHASPASVNDEYILKRADDKTFTTRMLQVLTFILSSINRCNENDLESLWNTTLHGGKGFTEISKKLVRYRSNNNIVGIVKIIT